MSKEWRDELVTKGAVVDALKGLEFCHYMEFGEYIGEDTIEVRLIRAEKVHDALQNLPPAQPKKVKWIKKMKVTETDAYTSYDPEWYCPKCGTKYDPTFAQRVKFCCVCGVGIMEEQEIPISRRFLQ